MRVAFSSAGKNWEETDDLATTLTATLNALGHAATAKGDWVELGEFRLLPQVVNVEPLESSGVKTASTIQISHSSLKPSGLFEYQHSSGTDLRDSFAKGFKTWADLDLPVFLDAQRARATDCMVMEMKPGQESQSVLPAGRRVVLGPTLHMAQNTQVIEGEHEFCPCCLFTNSIGAFDALLRDEDFHGVHLFVSRDAEGLIEADCRVDGIDRPEGAAALTVYAKSWPDRGFEYRKQYLCIQTRGRENG
ncbi:MAG TPA: DUF6348 family protein [Steroidobacteraceae bacterium]|nr:DUF6348 family protein [Steroidobacteraceae bacterium]